MADHRKFAIAEATRAYNDALIRIVEDAEFWVKHEEEHPVAMEDCFACQWLDDR